MFWFTPGPHGFCCDFAVAPCASACVRACVRVYMCVCVCVCVLGQHWSMIGEEARGVPLGAKELSALLRLELSGTVSFFFSSTLRGLPAAR